MSKKGYFFLNIVLGIISILLAIGLLLTTQSLSFPVAIVPLLAFFLLADFIPIKTKDFSVISNFAGIIPLIIFWNPHLAPFASLLLFLKPVTGEKLKVPRKIYRVLNYFLMYGLAAYFVDWSGNFYISLILFVLIARVISIVTADILYSIVLGRTKLNRKVVLTDLIEFAYFIFLAVYGGMMWNLYEMGRNLETALVFLLLPATTLGLWGFVQFINLSDEKEETLKRIGSLRNKLSKTLEMISLVRSDSNFQSVLNQIASIIRDSIGYKYVLINLFDRENNKVERVAQAGLESDEFTKLKDRPPEIDDIKQFFDENFRVSRSFFIPEGAKELDTTYTYQGDYDELIAGKGEWRANDLLIIPIVNKSDTIGYISVDAPLDGRRPRYEDIEILEIVADIVLRVLEEGQKYRRLVMASKIDSATGLYNHTEFFVILEKLLETSDEQFSLIMMDLDNFKLLNDSYGHIIGDKIIEQVANVIKKNLRKIDIGARYGGDEFCIIAVGSDKGEAIKVASRIAEKIRHIEVDGIKAQISFSIGISSYPADGQISTELVEKADKALYTAKQTGKDKIYVI
ncbi:MAG: sensor domain-containing diguanylate cyclase [Kosmotogaceae bacterium]